MLRFIAHVLFACFLFSSATSFAQSSSLKLRVQERADGKFNELCGNGNVYVVSSPSVDKCGAVPQGAEYLSIEGKEGSFCVLGKDRQVKCWGSNYSFQSEIPTLNGRVSQISVGARATCAIVDEKPVCWGVLKNAALPQFNKLFMIANGNSTACGVDVDGIKCWNKASVFVPTFSRSLLNARQVAMGPDGYGLCALDDKGVTCTEGYLYDLPRPLQNPVKLSVGLETSPCILDDLGPLCWGGWSKGHDNNPKMRNSRSIAMDFLMCSLQSNDVACTITNKESFAHNKPVLHQPYAIAMATKGICALDVNGVHCWNQEEFDSLDNTWILPSPNFTKTITNFSTNLRSDCMQQGNKIVCMLDDSYNMSHFPLQNVSGLVLGQEGFTSCGIKNSDGSVICADYNGQTNIQIPADVPKNPSHLAISGGYSAQTTFFALSQGKVTVWGNEQGKSPIALPFIRELASSPVEQYVCALGEHEVICWGRDQKSGATVEFPALKNLNNPHGMSLGRLGGCLIDEKKLKCWGDRANNYELNNVTAVSATAHTCAIDSGIVKCWENYETKRTDYLMLPNFPVVNPKQIFTAVEKTCVIDDEGFKCWGSKIYRP